MLIKIIICLLILIVIIAVGVIAFDSNRFVVRKYTISSDKVSKDIRVVFLSDLHNKTYGRNNTKLLDCIEKLEPDMILCGGDMMTASKHGNHCYDNAVPFLKAVSGFAPFFYAFGNHESRARANRENKYGRLFTDFQKSLADEGVTLSDNCCDRVCDINITGLTVPERFYYRKKPEKMTVSDVEQCVGKADSDSLNILLAHNPEHFDAYAEWGADIVLSGHYHGGVVRVPFIGKGIISPRFKLFPKYDGGIYTKGGSEMIISRGLGMHTIPLRMFNPGEIVVLTIKRP